MTAKEPLSQGRPFRLQEAVTDPADDEGLRALRSLTALLRAKSWDEPENSGDGP